MKVVLQGVRGSSPASGTAFARVGGHTSCVALSLAGAAAPSLLLDAGTGLVNVDTSLAGAAYRGDILLTHLHWDHMQGLPFFAAGDRPDAQVRLLLPAQGDASPSRPGSASALLAGCMSPPHFPIRPECLRGGWTFEALDPGVHALGGFTVTAAEVPHKGGRTFGYRVEAEGASLAYLPDHRAPAGGAGLALARGVDVLLHGGMFHESEQARADDYGHATGCAALRLAEAAGARRLVLVHHAPTRTDDQVVALATALTGSLPVVVGCEGDVVLDTR